MPVANLTDKKGLEKHKQLLASMDKERADWFPHWREISDYYLPRRYPWLRTAKENKTAGRRNTKLLSSTSTMAVRTLASGMMNGITSPARNWFSLRIPGFDQESMSQEAAEYLEEVERRIMLVLSESNFYNSIAMLYLEWCTFGTASMSIEEDFDDVVRCYNYPLGEFYLSTDSTGRVNRHGRRFVRTVEQLVEQFGEENVSEQVLADFKQGGAKLFLQKEVAHLIEAVSAEAADQYLSRWRSVYWEVGVASGKYLAMTPVYEWPMVSPRWELLGDDSYGTSPAMDALADTIELQNLLLERAKGLAKQISPPLIIDQQLRNRPKALGANGITYAATYNSNFGAKEAYKVNTPLDAIAFDVAELKRSIQATCYNPLFNMISQLDTVRSATEIDARREEKLVHLASVLERFYNEGLDPALKRVFGIMQRSGLLPDPPEELDEAAIEVNYISVLTDAQRASGTITIERFLQFIGNISGVYPEATRVPDVEELIRSYATGIGIKPKGLKSKEDVAAAAEAENAQAELAQSAQVGNDLAAGAKVLSETDVGGGMNALQSML
jgi:hypothetical protein